MICEEEMEGCDSWCNWLLLLFTLEMAEQASALSHYSEQLELL
jgi:hypothetical protein